jgi:hypothetical protein
MYGAYSEPRNNTKQGTSYDNLESPCGDLHDGSAGCYLRHDRDSSGK